MRPTIPIAGWRVATDLELTRAVVTRLPQPECERTCPWCRNWAVVHASVLPPALLDELRRLGIDPARPADLYAYDEPANAGEPVPHRVTFYSAGRVLDGPDVWFEHPKLGRTRRYEPVAGPQGTLRPGLSVADARRSGAGVPVLAVADGSLVQVDFRIPVPWALAEPRPGVGGRGAGAG